MAMKILISQMNVFIVFFCFGFYFFFLIHEVVSFNLFHLLTRSDSSFYQYSFTCLIFFLFEKGDRRFSIFVFVRKKR